VLTYFHRFQTSHVRANVRFVRAYIEFFTGNYLPCENTGTGVASLSSGIQWFIFPFGVSNLNFLHCRSGDRKAIRPVKNCATPQTFSAGTRDGRKLTNRSSPGKQPLKPEVEIESKWSVAESETVVTSSLRYEFDATSRKLRFVCVQ